MQHRTPEELPGEDDAPIDEDGEPAQKEEDEDDPDMERAGYAGSDVGRADHNISRCVHGYVVASTGEWTGFREVQHGDGAGVRVFHRLLAACCPECADLRNGSNP